MTNRTARVIGHKNRPGPPAAAGAVALAVVAGLIGGCSGGMAGIDRRTDRLLRQRTEHINAEAAPTGRRFPKPDDLDNPALVERRPPTRNPAAGDLTYPVLPTAEDEAAQITARLSSFQTLPEEAAPDDPLVLRMDLEEAFHQAQRTSRDYLRAEEDYIFSAIRLLIERHLWGPRFFAESSLGFSGSQNDGDPTAALNIINELRATQRLPYGGDVAARFVWEATENLRSNVSDRYTQSSALILSGNIPLLRGAGEIAREDLIQAERDLIYSARDFERFRREFLVRVASDYFFLLQQAATIQNSRQQLQAVERLEEQQQARFRAGRVRQTQVLIAANQVLSTRSSIANQRDSYILALDRFKILLGLPPETKLVIEPVELYVPIPASELEPAVATALEYRLDLQNQRDRLVDARRGVRNARNQLLPDLGLAGSVAFDTDPDAREGGVAFEGDDISYSASLSLDWALDREIERLQLRGTIIAYEQQLRDFERAKDDIAVDVRSRVRAIELQRFNYLLAEQRVRQAALRQKEDVLRADERTAQEVVDTEIELNDARNARDAAVTALRLAVLDYLLATDQMRVARDGTFMPLPGMEGAGVRPIVRPDSDVTAPDAEPPLAPVGPLPELPSGPEDEEVDPSEPVPSDLPPGR